jgi:hypothetical protein
MDVPYEQLSAAEDTARVTFPNADAVRAGWSPASEHPIYVEVWETCERTGERAGRIYAWQA